MEVEYILGLDEALALNQYHHEHSPLLRRRMRLLRAALPVGCLAVWAVLCPAFRDAGFAATFGLLLAVISVVYFFCYPSLVRKRTIQMVRRLYAESPSRGVFGRRRMTITPETITEAGELTVTTKKWAAIDKIVEDERHAYFYVSALSAFILPKPAFPTEEEFHRFVETARQYHREAPA